MPRSDDALKAEKATGLDLTVENDGVLPVLSMPTVMLACLIAPLPMLWAMTLPFGLLIALLGHPWIGLISTLANMTADWLAQRCYAAWRPTADADEPGLAIRRISLAACLRAMVAMSGVVAVVLAHGAAAELIFAGVMTSMLLCVAVAQGSLSPRLFWMSAWPVLAGLVVMIVARFPLAEAANLLVATGLLGGMLLLLSGGVARILGDWSAMRERNNRLIERLVMERAEAEQAREEARRAGQAKASFLATMSHEIRTPMNGVLGMAHLLKSSAADEEQSQRIDTLIHSGEFLMSILNDILDISRIDAGQLDILNQPEDLHALAAGLGELWSPTAEAKGLFLAVEVQPGTPRHVSMDARRFRQILFNLIGNAVKFTNTGGVAIAIGHKPMADGRVELRVAVQDTGIGIEADCLPGLFERFSQADQSISRRFGGAGLGLAISRQLTELMGGRLWVQSSPGQGSCFRLTLPLDLAVAPEARAPDAAPPEAANPARPLCLLVVDDNAVNLKVLDHILGALGHQTICGDSGPEALALAAAQPFDLILLDIQMPGMSGLDVLRALRATDGPNRATPALAVTADVLSHDHGGYLALGFAGHVSKPIQVASLAAEIDLAMADAQPSVATA
jgi:signal transduction histidine kinase/ActR/RegA family two-component response regulator